MKKLSVIALVICALMLIWIPAGAEAIKGDMDGNGKIDILDVLELLKCVTASPTSADALKGDMDGNGKAEITDVLTVLKSVTTSTPVEENKGMQIIPDIDLRKGIQLLSQKDHNNGNRFSVLDTHDFYGGTAQSPVWRLAQWDSGPCLVANRIESDVTTITDGVGRTFAYYPDEKRMKFELDTSLYYKGKAAVSGDYWPHLLAEQNSFLTSYDLDTMQYLTCDPERLVLSLDIRLTEFSQTPINGDWARAAQFQMYFYVKGLETSDFCWFGVHFFDNRFDNTDHNIGYDGGKPDASNAMIFTIGTKYTYANSGRTLYKNGQPDTSGEWVHVEIDLKPYLEEMLARGKQDGYFDANSLSELYIDGMNVGWETIATFDHTMEMKNIELVSYNE